MDERGREVEPALHAAGVALDAPVGGVDEVDELEQLPARVGGLRPRAAEQPGLQDEQLAAGLARVEPGLLQRDADLPAGGVRIGGHVDAGDARRARRDRHERRQHPDGRRLAGAVRSEEAEDLAGIDLQVDAAHGFDRAAAAGVVLDELFGFHRESHDPTLGRGTDNKNGRGTDNKNGRGTDSPGAQHPSEQD